jgi:hypothetical protein
MSADGHDRGHQSEYRTQLESLGSRGLHDDLGEGESEDDGAYGEDERPHGSNL